MVKNVPLIPDFYDTSVIITAIEHGSVRRLVGTDVRIVVAYNNTAVHEITVWESADGVTEFMPQNGGIDQVIQAVPLSDGGGFVKLMTFKARPLTVKGIGDQKAGSLFDSDHVRL